VNRPTTIQPGHLLLADGTRFDGTLHGPATQAVGWIVANTAVVGFQEMVTDPAYSQLIVAFTYPEVGSVGRTERFSESAGAQAAGLVVKSLSDFPSHYLSEGQFADLLTEAGAPCLGDIDTRGLAVHLRQNGEMPGAIVPAGADLEAVEAKLREMDRPAFESVPASSIDGAGEGPVVAVLNLGARRSQLTQLAECCKPVVFAHDATAETILSAGPAGLFVSDGPGMCFPPARAVETVKALLGEMPVLACGLGHLTLGAAMGCEIAAMRRGHHGVNYPVRDVMDDTAEVTQQRHSVVLDRRSVESNARVQLTAENMTDQTVEGIRSRDGSAVGIQSMLNRPLPGRINEHMRRFVQGLPS